MPQWQLCVSAAAHYDKCVVATLETHFVWELKSLFSDDGKTFQRLTEVIEVGVSQQVQDVSLLRIRSHQQSRRTIPWQCVRLTCWDLISAAVCLQEVVHA